MSIAVRVLFAIFAGFATVSAQAQLLPTWETNIVLTQQDLDMIHGVVTNQVHGKPVGTVASWSNPASGNSGSVKLVKKTRSEKSAMRGSRIYGSLERLAAPIPSTIIDQLSQAGRDLETCLDRLTRKTAGVAGI